MEKLPDPPSSFEVDPVAHTLGSGSTVFRIYFKRGAHPSTWNAFRRYGPTSSRFDHHTYPKRLQHRGILYGASGSDAILTALAECFQETRLIDRSHNEPWLAAFELTAAVDLLDTGSRWPVRAGGNMAINSGARWRSRKWSRAIYRQYKTISGIWYPSSLTNSPCVALYERALEALPSHPAFDRPLAHPGLFALLTTLASKIGYALR